LKQQNTRREQYRREKKLKTLYKKGVGTKYDKMQQEYSRIHELVKKKDK
jgi:hypothetical protein